VSDNIREDQEAMAETIENNIRKVIVEERPGNPKYYEKMSQLLEELIRQRKQEAAEYARYLKKLEKLARKVKRSEGQEKYPEELKTEGQKALYDNLDEDKEQALVLDETIRYNAKDGWRKQNPIKERMLRNAVKKTLSDAGKLDDIMEIIREQNEY